MPIWTVPFSTSFSPVPEPLGVTLTVTVLFAALAGTSRAARWKSGASADEPSILRVPAGSVGAVDLPPPGTTSALAVTWQAVRAVVALLDDAQAPADSARRTATAPSNTRLIALMIILPSSAITGGAARKPGQSCRGGRAALCPVLRRPAQRHSRLPAARRGHTARGSHLCG